MPSAPVSIATGQMPNSSALAPPGSRPHFLNSQQFSLFFVSSIVQPCLSSGLVHQIKCLQQAL
jgi:hypothetical protein